ncbi:MAG: hypothetical protein ABIJ09_15960 [Pseudomonadota bacterium]
MPIAEQRRARLAAQITTLSLEQVRELKGSVEKSSGHSYNEVQTHAWGMCGCAGNACPPWVEQGFTAAEQAVRGASLAASGHAAKREEIADVLDMTALEMTGLLRGVVLDADEIKSSKQAEDGDVFASNDDDKS